MQATKSFQHLYQEERLRNADWAMRVRVGGAGGLLLIDALLGYRGRLLPSLMFLVVGVVLWFVSTRSRTVRRHAFLTLPLVDIPFVIFVQAIAFQAAASGDVSPQRFGALVGYTYASFLFLLIVSQLSLRRSTVLLVAAAGIIGQLGLMELAGYGASLLSVAITVFLGVSAAGTATYLVHRTILLLDRAAGLYGDLQALNEDLEQRVVQRTEALELANVGLRAAQARLVQSEKMASLGQLIAGVAHELNTPVGSLRSSANTGLRAVEKLRAALASHPGVAEDKKVSRTIEVLERACQTEVEASERVTSVVDSLRSFSRLDEASRKLASLHEGLDTTLGMVEHQLADRIEVTRHYGASVPDLVCFPAELNQAFMGVISNAVDAIDGKGTITITTALEDDHVALRFADDGCGIAAEHRERVFDPGFTTKGVGVGAGLGLAISYQIAAKHQGTIEVEESSDAGTTILMRLPLADT